MNNKYKEFREKYDTFIYHDYKIEIENQNIVVEFEFEIVGLSTFNPKLIIPTHKIKDTLRKNGFDQSIDVTSNIVKNLVFNIGMVEVVSYLKLTCSKNLIIECGYLNDDQKIWFKKLYLNGLGEFFYINNIDVNEDEFIIIKSNEDFKNLALESPVELKGQLIPVGGGKDSNVTMEVLRTLKNENTAFIVNARGATIESTSAAGYEDDTIIIERILDKNMLELNQKGFLNGHTPFSAMLAFLTTFIAYISRKKYIVLSNESSANEPNVVGTTINHQYSKSIEFENDFRYYSDTYLKTGTQYFSLLRPLTELQITALFARYEKYHPVFKSCNVGSKKNIWCANCSKCLFVYIMLSQFLDEDKMIKIFGENLLNKESLRQTFIELIGKGDNKPFDCVGTYEEINYSLCSHILKCKNKDSMPILLNEYFNNEYNNNIDSVKKVVEENREKLLKGYCNNNLPTKFEELLKNELKVL